MNKKRILVFLLLLTAFCVCFSIYAFGLLVEDKPPRVYNISVIVRGKNSESWDSVKQGCDQAASEMNVELSFITLSEENNSVEQAALLNRELEGGADAAIIAAADSEKLVPAVEQTAAKIPVICIESPVDSSRISSYISADNYEMGAQLGREIIASGNARKRIAVIESSWQCENVRERMDGLINALGPLGNEMIYWQVPDNSMQASQMIAEQLEKGKTDVVITLDVTALELAAQAISGSYTESVKLFGIGSTGRVASFIEQGTISATIVQNDFGIGYLGVKSAVDAIEARPVASAFEVEHRLINIKNMYDTENQRLLFPFIR